MREIVIGERANLPAQRRRDQTAAKYLRLMLKLRAFNDTRSRQKLARIGVHVAEAESANLLLQSPQGVPWDAGRAREVAEDWLLRLRGCLAYLAGGRVARAFGVTERSLREVYGRSLRIGGVVAVVIPHPSGLNHFWNDAGDVSRLRRRLSKTIRQIGASYEQKIRQGSSGARRGRVHLPRQHKTI